MISPELILSLNETISILNKELEKQRDENIKLKSQYSEIEQERDIIRRQLDGFQSQKMMELNEERVLANLRSKRHTTREKDGYDELDRPIPLQ